MFFTFCEPTGRIKRPKYDFFDCDPKLFGKV